MTIHAPIAQKLEQWKVGESVSCGVSDVVNVGLLYFCSEILVEVDRLTVEVEGIDDK
jgi:hypothetical protein